MKKLVLFTVFLIFFTTISFAQEIEMKMGLMGHKFTQSGIKLSWNDVMNETKANPKAFELIKKAKSQNIISSILSFGGGFLIGIPVGASISGDEPNWTLAYIGGGIALVGLPLAINSTKKTREGIRLYNSSLTKTSSNFRPEYKIIANGKGIGLSMSF